MLRVENRVEKGTPDVCWAARGGHAAGWLELKSLPRWPAREATVIRLPKLTQEQVRWPDEHPEHHYRMLLHVGGRGGGYALLEQVAVLAIYNRALTRAVVIATALVWGAGAFPAAEIVRALTGRAAPR
jgi:hypothetical protein